MSAMLSPFFCVLINVIIFLVEESAMTALQLSGMHTLYGLAFFFSTFMTASCKPVHDA